jgi:hypothetical protein
MGADTQTPGATPRKDSRILDPGLRVNEKRALTGEGALLVAYGMKCRVGQKSVVRHIEYPWFRRRIGAPVKKPPTRS